MSVNTSNSVLFSLNNSYQLLAKLCGFCRSLNDNDLQCDCNLAWLVDWVRDNRVRVFNTASCRDQQGRDIPLLDYSCCTCRYLSQTISSLQLHYIITLTSTAAFGSTDVVPSVVTVTPSREQLVFAGDKVPLKCSSNSKSQQLRWTHNDADVNVSNHIFIHRSSIETSYCSFKTTLYLVL